MAAPGKGVSTASPPLPVSRMPSIYDTYLCKELLSRSPSLESASPENYDTRLRILQSSSGYFLQQDRIRAVERLQLETARVYMQEKKWANALRVMRPLWQTLSWRQAGWWHLVEEVDWALRECARMVGDGDTLIAVEWELLSQTFKPRPDMVDFSQCLEGLVPFDTRPTTVVQAGKIVSCLSANFAFASKQAYVGERMSFQMVISSRAQNSSSPITLKEVKIAFEGRLRNVEIHHSPNGMTEVTTEDGRVYLQNVPLRKPPPDADESTSFKPGSSIPSNFVGQCDLKFAPGVRKVLLFDIIPHDSGDVEAVSVTLCVKEKDFDFEIVVAESELLRQEGLWFKDILGPSKKKLGSENSSIFKILPKPPKMRIEFPSLKRSYFTDELAVIDIHLINEEEADADLILEVALLGNSDSFPYLNWSSEGTLSETTVRDITDEGPSHRFGKVSSVSIGQLSVAEMRKVKVSLQASSDAAEYLLKVRALYRLLSDPDTPIKKTTEIDLEFIRPFEANYNLVPGISLDLWPSYFRMGDREDSSELTTKEETVAHGLRQNWALTARIGSFGTETIVIESVSLHLVDTLNDAKCKISYAKESVQGEAVITPSDIQRRKFDLELQKYSLEDGRPTILHLQLEIKWQRESPLALSAITYVAVPEIVIPFGEPRVLAVARSEQERNGLIHLDYIIENPSMYVLEFNLTMEISEEFAFSGIKATSLQLVPLSRHTVRYNLLPLVTGSWINPQFKVVDLHFNKTLRIHATEGIKSHGQGISIWADADH